jgi:lipopolysaccharide biosynthesis regulator YciM
MSDVNLLERLLDRAEKMSEELVQVREQATAIQARLDKINGSVGRHDTTINELRVWTATKDQSCSVHLREIADLAKALKEHQDENQISNQTVLKIAVLAAITVMTVFQVGGPLVEKLVGLVK